LRLGRRLSLLLIAALASSPTLATASTGSAAAVTPELGPVQHIAVNGMSVGYRTGGSGFPLILVIGRSATMAEWDPPLIEELIGDHEVIVFDNRGVATTDNPGNKAITIGQMAEDTLALASALQIERFDLMGWSMGSYISQQVAIDAPSRVAKLVLCATDSGGSHYVPPTPRVASILTNPEGVTTTQLLGLSFPPTRAGISGAVDYMYNLATQPDLVPESFTISTATLEGQASAIDGWKAAGAGSWEALPTLKMPTLVTWGNLDRGIRPRNDRIVARRIPNSRAVVFKGAGHAFLFQDPSQVGGTVDGFLG